MQLKQGNESANHLREKMKKSEVNTKTQVSLRTLLLRHWPLFLLSFFFSTCHALITASFAFLAGPFLIGLTQPPRQEKNIIGIQIPFVNQLELHSILWVMVVLASFKMLFLLLHQRSISLLETRITSQIREKLFSLFLDLSSQEAFSSKPKTLAKLILNEAESLKSFIRFGLTQQIQEGIMAVTLAVFIVKMDTQVAFFMGVLILLGSLFLRKVSRKTREIHAQLFDKERQIIEEVIENEELLPSLKSLNAETFIRGKFQKALENLESSVLLSNLYRTSIPIFSQGILLCTFLFLIVFYLPRLEKGDLSTSLFISIVAALLVLVRSLRSLVSSYYDLSGAKVAFERIENAFELVSEQPFDRKEPFLFRDQIQVSTLSFSYSKGLPLLTEIDFSIPKGETVILYGENGSGKSTLLKLIGGLLKPEQGQVMFDEIPLTSIDKKLFHSQVLWMSQKPALWKESICKNITLGCDSTSIAKAKSIFDEIFVEPTQSSDLLEKKLLKGGENLSGGQKQKVAFMRMLYREPQVILMDEPSANLDAKSKKKVYSILDQLKQKGHTILIATHDPELICLADRVLHLHTGKLIFNGSLEHWSSSKINLRRV
jgi:ABC-type bacteriocin/lantibiotic exporter with double-glycine peptidase domain